MSTWSLLCHPIPVKIVHHIVQPFWSNQISLPWSDVVLHKGLIFPLLGIQQIIFQELLYFLVQVTPHQTHSGVAVVVATANAIPVRPFRRRCAVVVHFCVRVGVHQRIQWWIFIIAQDDVQRWFDTFPGALQKRVFHLASSICCIPTCRALGCCFRPSLFPISVRRQCSYTFIVSITSLSARQAGLPFFRVRSRPLSSEEKGLT